MIFFAAFSSGILDDIPLDCRYVLKFILDIVMREKKGKDGGYLRQVNQSLPLRNLRSCLRGRMTERV